MSYETPEVKRAELIRFRLEELKALREEVGRNTNNRMMKDFRNQLAHCSISYGPYGAVFIKEESVMRQIARELRHLGEEETSEDERGYEKVYVEVGGKRRILYHIYSLKQWEQLYHQFRAELSQTGELISLPRTVLGCPQCGDFPASDSGSGRVVCPHVRNGTEKVYMRDEFGDSVGGVTFERSPSGVE